MKNIGRAAEGFSAGLALLCAMFAGTPALPGSKNGQFAVEEVGRTSCASFLAARKAKSPLYEQQIGFVQGYMTAANRYEPNTFDLSPWHNAEAFALIVEKHCQAHPTDTMVTTTQRMVVAMMPIRVADFSKLIEVGDGNNKTVLYETILKRAQTALTRRGLYKGEANGIYDKNVKAAVAQFQKASKLEPTGVPDPATLWLLLNP